nr:hypothetical protein [Blastocatellia bacterium]
MKLSTIPAILCSLAFLSGSEVLAQKGVDNQTEKIREDSRTNARGSDVTRVF